MIIHVSDALFFGDDIFHVHDFFLPRILIRVTRRVSLVEQELLTRPEHLRSFSFLVGFVLLNR